MGMEPDAKDLLKRVMWSLGIVLLYLMINSTAGIMGEWLFFDEKPTLGNYIFYAWLLISTFLLIFLLIKWWRKKLPHG